MRVLAQDEEVLLIDINAMWSENAAATQLMMSDALHPNAAGHLTWCRFMLKSLGMYSEESELAKVTYADISREYEPESQQHKIKTDKEISAALAEFINNSEPVTWVFVGGESTEELNLPMQFRSYVSHFNEAVRWEIAMDSLAKRSKTIINSGRAGYLPDNILKNYDELAGRFNPDVLVYLPDLSGAKLSADSLEEGGEFYKALMSLSEKATGNGAKLLLLTPPEIADKETAELLKAALSDAAEKFGAIFIDTAEILPEQENAADSHFALGRALALTCTKLPKTSRMK